MDKLPKWVEEDWQKAKRLDRRARAGDVLRILVCLALGWGLAGLVLSNYYAM